MVAALSLFAERRGDEVVEFHPEQGVVVLSRIEGLARLQFDETEVLRLLDGSGEDGSVASGVPRSDEAAAAWFLSVHLDESLAWDQPHESGWWTYRVGRFEPVPPWEAHTRRAQGRRESGNAATP